MCKHVAAVLYGVGARLDEQPELIFRLRRVDAKDLVSQAGAGLPKSTHAPAAGKVLDDALLADVFGIEMAEVAPAKQSADARDKPAAKVAKTPAKAAPTTTRKANTAKKADAAKVTVTVPERAKAADATTTLPKPMTATAGRIADQPTADRMASKATKRTVTAQRAVKAILPVKTSAGARKSKTAIVAPSKQKVTGRTTRPKEPAVKTEGVAGRLVKDKSR